MDDICFGNSIDLSVSITGNGTFEIKIQENANPPVSYFGINNIDVINLTPSASGAVTYSLVEIKDSNFPPCTITLNSSTTFNVYDPPTGILSGIDTICDGDQAQLELAVTGIWTDYSIWLNDGVNPYQFSNVNDGDMINVPSPSTITYCIDSIAPVSFPSCVSQNVMGCVEIYVSDLPEIVSYDVVCDPITEEGIVTISVSDGDSKRYHNSRDKRIYGK